MASAQFIHIETYGKKSAKKAERKNLNHNSDVRQTTISGVMAEARRDEGFTSHIDEPHAPALLWGSPLQEVEQMAEDYYNNTYTVDKNGKQKRLRSDASIILAGVISIDRKDEEIWHDYKKDAFKFLREKYGDKLKSVIEHVDEAHP
ncbi:plasmid recombination protein, partial [Klebsiella pneumoniae]|nr:plasmid recombination protein [Klebsiella pneumoniae]